MNIYPSQTTEAAQQWRSNNRESCNEAAKRYRKKHQEAIKARKTDEIRAKDAQRARTRRQVNPEAQALIDLKHRQKTQTTQMFRRAKRRAKTKGVPFDLSVEDIIIPELCPILGIPLMVGVGACGGNGGPTDSSPSLDRIIPELGYVKGNVQVISNRANRFKSDASIEELEAVVRHMTLMINDKRCTSPSYER